MSKAIRYAKNAALAVGIGNAILNIREQLQVMETNPELKFDWKQMFTAAGRGALLGGTGGLGFGAIADFNNSQVKPIRTDNYLHKLADKIKLDKESPKYKLVNGKAEFLSAMLTSRFRNKLVCAPEQLGSTEKGTALQSKFDIDLALKFWHNSFSTTERMRLAILKFLQRKVGKNHIVDVREQRSSIGVIFNINGHEFKIDVVQRLVNAMHQYHADFL